MGSASSSSLRAAGLLDPNRAFQAINAETLEVASALADYPVPPVPTQVPPAVMHPQKAHAAPCSSHLPTGLSLQQG